MQLRKHTQSSTHMEANPEPQLVNYNTKKKFTDKKSLPKAEDDEVTND